MKFKFSTCTATVAFLAALAIPVRLIAQDAQQGRSLPRYSITDLGTLGGRGVTGSEGVGVSNRGAVSGTSYLAGDVVQHGFIWQKGVMTDLGTLGGPNSFAPEEWPPNDRDEVAGFSDTSTVDPNNENFCSPFSFMSSPYICLPFVWRHGVLTPLPTLGGNNGAAVAINNRGQVAGASETDVSGDCVPLYEAAVWSNRDDIQELPPLPGDTEAITAGINDSGEVVGSSGNCTSGPIEAVLWRNGNPINLGSLGGAVFNIAFGINNRSEVVGQSDLSGDMAHHAFLWKNGVMTDLGTFGGLPVSLATSINSKSQVVGFSQENDFSNTVACLWQNGTAIDLNTLIPADSPWFLIEALGINDRGQITGYAFNPSTNEVHGYLLTPREDNDNSAPAVLNSPRSRILLPEHIRQLLKRQIERRYHFGGLGVSTN